MADPKVRQLGRVDDLDGIALWIGVDYDSVALTVAGRQVRLEAAQAAEFAQFYTAACWEAAKQATVP